MFQAAVLTNVTLLLVYAYNVVRPVSKYIVYFRETQAWSNNIKDAITTSLNKTCENNDRFTRDFLANWNLSGGRIKLCPRGRSDIL